MAAKSEQAKQRAREQQKVWREANRDRVREVNKKNNAARSAKYRAANQEKVGQLQSDYYKRNREEILAKCKTYRDTNKNYKLAAARWAAANIPAVRALSAHRRAKLKKATVAWADREAIKAIYAEADRLTAETGVAHVVDHIIPLNSKLVCGLHCEANLRVITAEENGAKSNKFLEVLPV